MSSKVTTADLEKDKERWRQMRQQLAEAEDCGVDTLKRLHDQREQLTRIRDGLVQAEDNIDQANNTLKTMSRRQFWMRVLSLGMF